MPIILAIRLSFPPPSKTACYQYKGFRKKIQRNKVREARFPGYPTPVPYIRTYRFAKTLHPKTRKNCRLLSPARKKTGLAKRIFVLADKENAVLPDSFHGDNTLHRLWHHKLFFILLKQVSKRFYHVLPPYAFLISLLSFSLVSPPCISASVSGRASLFPLPQYSASRLHSRNCLV